MTHDIAPVISVFVIWYLFCNIIFALLLKLLSDKEFSQNFVYKAFNWANQIDQTYLKLWNKRVITLMLLNISLVGTSTDTRKLVSFYFPTRDNIHQFQCNNPIVKASSRGKRICRKMRGENSETDCALRSQIRAFSLTDKIDTRSKRLIDSPALSIWGGSYYFVAGPTYSLWPWPWHDLGRCAKFGPECINIPKMNQIGGKVRKEWGFKKFNENLNICVCRCQR